VVGFVEMNDSGTEPPLFHALYCASTSAALIRFSLPIRPNASIRSYSSMESSFAKTSVDSMSLKPIVTSL
jgi:hypothetical protein